jgi:5'-nucleotidase
MSDRRRFIREAGMAAAGMALSGRLSARDPGRGKDRRLTILHTNDVHSRLEPFPADGGSNAGRGGVAARAALVRKIREEGDPVLLLDAGDIFQGTPYFNVFKGEPELRAMTMMGYDAATMGNHDFDAGIANFAEQTAAHARFPIVVCNYDFSGTPMEARYIPRMVVRKGDLKIGITGVGIELDGLVPQELYGATRYLDPVAEADRQALILRRREGCDLVICLSHLGDAYKDGKVSDERLAQDTENIDLIIGGHTHRFFDAPRIYRNRRGLAVAVNQVGWAGLRLGRLDYVFESGRGHRIGGSESILVEKKTLD